MVVLLKTQVIGIGIDRDIGKSFLPNYLSRFASYILDHLKLAT
jgi:hypothetical protein